VIAPTHNSPEGNLKYLETKFEGAVTISLFDFWRCIFVTLPKRQRKVQCRVRQGPGGILGVTLDQSAQRAEHWDTLALQLEYPKPLQFITTAMTF
jgi:hypothetical protein